MEINVRKLQAEDTLEFQDLVRLLSNVFEWEHQTLPPTAYLEKVLANPSFVVFVAQAKDQVVGGLTGYILDRYDLAKPSFYLYDIAVLPDFQRLGIGKMLISSLTLWSEEQDHSEVFVQADIDDVHAVNFYRSTAASHELTAIHFTYLLGRNISGKRE